jgi:hypothetical protein
MVIVTVTFFISSRASYNIDEFVLRNLNGSFEKLYSPFFLPDLSGNEKDARS